jgi:hypothetical protein
MAEVNLLNPEQDDSDLIPSKTALGCRYPKIEVDQHLRSIKAWPQSNQLRGANK